MTTTTLVAALLALAATCGAARWALRWVRRPASRPAPWRIVALLALQLASTFLLFRVLVPPEGVVTDTTLVVMTAGADASAARLHGGTVAVVALPEAGREAALRADAERMPDLATALRAHPGATRLEVVGQGLEARDIPPARGLAIGYEAPPLPRGFVEVRPTSRVVPGGLLRVAGRMHGVEGGRVELLDPSGALQDRVAPDADGRFRLEGPVRAQGPALWRLRLVAPRSGDEPGAAGTVDGAGAPMAVIEEVDVPVDAHPGARQRVLLLAGAPNPEVKYLRRWAVDAGLDLHSRMSLGGGTTLGDGPVALASESLAGFDLVILDERAWAGLGGDARRHLLAAVDAGLGLAFRITAPPDATTEQALRALGFALAREGAPATREVRFTAAQPRDDGDATDPMALPALPALARQPLRLVAADSIPLLHDADGRPLAHWRAVGRGRVAAWNLDQSFRWVLTGHAERHARLWSEVVGTLARADGRARPRLPVLARVGQRAILCGLTPDAAVVDPDGARLHPVPDPAAGGCAAVWPRRGGWHRIGDGEAAVHLYVREVGELPGVEAMARRETMLELQAGSQVPADGVRAPALAPGPRWPWFFGWLAASALLWWLERKRGRPAATPSGPAMP